MSIDRNAPLRPPPFGGASRVEQLEAEFSDLRVELDRATRELGAARAEVAILTQTRDALRETEARLADVFRLAPSFMCVLRGPRHVYELANDYYCEFVGRRDLIGLSVLEAFPEVEYQVFPRLLDEVYRTGVPFVGTDVTVFLRRGPGGPLVESLIDLVYQVLRDPDGAVTGVFVQGIDLTARKRAEQELARLVAATEREKRLLHTVLSNTVDFNYTFDLDGRFTFANSAILTLWGKALSDALGKNFHDLDYPPDLADKLQRQIRQVIETRQQVRDETPYTTAAGEGLYEYILVPVIGEGGAVEAVAGSTRDITERKRAEDALRQSQFFQSSIDALSSTIAVLDETGVILAVNESWRHFADENGYAVPNHGVGSNYLGACPFGPDDPGEGRAVAAGLWDVQNGLQPLFELEYPCHSPTEERWFVIRVTRFQTPGPVRVVVAHEDVTRRKQSERKLEEADRRKDEFLATLAHELRNPLAPLLTGLHVLKMSGTDSAAAEATRAMMERQLGQMVRLVDDLLDVSRINSGKLDLRRERVELAGVVRNAVETSRPLIDRQGHELTVALPPGPVPLDADPVRLAQVFSNLLNNAAKYSDRGGRIGLTADVAGGEVIVRVRDAGIGIDPGQLARVFDIFAQVQTALEKSQGGLGIGLSLVKGLVGMHGGTVGVTSGGLGRGSEFVVRLPVATGSPAETAAPAGEVPAGRPARRRVLIVDDNVDAAESLGELLAFAGHDVRTAHGGTAGVVAAAEFRPDVMLLDLGMPKLNGYEAARRVRAEPWGASVVLVALTGWGSAEDRRKTHAAGFDHHFVKPVESGAILKLLAAV